MKDTDSGFFSRICGFRVFLSRGTHAGRHTWHYVKVPTLKVPLFRKAAQAPKIDIADFGEILASGWGEHPPQEIQDRMDELYG